MGSLSVWHWVVVLGVVFIVFGGGKRLSSTMGELGKGLKIFRKEISEIGEKNASSPPKNIMANHLEDFSLSELEKIS